MEARCAISIARGEHHEMHMAIEREFSPARKLDSRLKHAGITGGAAHIRTMPASLLKMVYFVRVDKFNYCL